MRSAAEVEALCARYVDAYKLAEASVTELLYPNGFPPGVTSDYRISQRAHEIAMRCFGCQLLGDVRAAADALEEQLTAWAALPPPGPTHALVLREVVTALRFAADSR